MGFKKIKNGFVEIVKEHPFSVACELLSMILYSVIVDEARFEVGIYSVLRCTAFFLQIFTFIVLPCEIYRLYKRKNDASYSFHNRKYLSVNIVILVVGAVLDFFTSVSYAYDSAGLAQKIGAEEMTVEFFSEYIYRTTICFIVAAICVSLYLFLKKSGSSFETYTAKAFCGIMKAELVFLVVFIGLTLVFAAFSALISELDYEVYERLWILLVGLIQYPCILIGLSKTDDEISKFGKVMLNYVLTALLMIAYAIIYIYIIKVIVKWEFPLYTVFGILTALFGFGVFIWTMAQGICEDNMRKFFNIIPLFFIPCIVMEIMSLGRQIYIYGLTLARYAGIAAIVFEVVYLVLYIYNLKKEKNMMPLVFVIIVVIAYASLLAPGINAYSAVIASNKGIVMKYLKENKEGISEHSVRESYMTIAYSCGAAGKNYLHKKLSEAQIEEMGELVDRGDNNDIESFYVYVSAEGDGPYDISGDYTQLYNADILYDGDKNETNEGYLLDLCADEEIVGKVELDDIISKLIEAEHASDKEKEAIIEEAVELEDGGKLIIQYIDISGKHMLSGDKVDSINAGGYVLK